MVNHAQDLMSVKIFFVLPNKLIPIIYYTLILSIRLLVAGLHSANKQSYIHCGLKMELAAQLGLRPAVGTAAAASMMT